MKIRIDLALNIDRDAWERDMCDVDNPGQAHVRTDVREWVAHLVHTALDERGLLVHPPTREGRS